MVTPQITDQETVDLVTEPSVPQREYTPVNKSTMLLITKLGQLRTKYLTEMQAAREKAKKNFLK